MERNHHRSKVVLDLSQSFEQAVRPSTARAAARVALHATPQEDWSLARMAAVAGMSRSAFAEAFKTVTGTPLAYLTDWRLMVAVSLLRAGRPQKLVAAELGFSTASSLSRAHKQRFAASPREWLARP